MFFSCLEILYSIYFIFLILQIEIIMPVLNCVKSEEYQKLVGTGVSIVDFSATWCKSLMYIIKK